MSSNDGNFGYASWLGKLLFEEGLPLKRFVSMDMRIFLEKYSLERSDWLTMLYGGQLFGESNVLLVFRWDVMVLSTSSVDTSVRKWPTLLVLLEEVKSIETSHYAGEDGFFGTVEAAAASTVGDNTLFVIEDLCGGCVDIRYSGNTSFLSLDAEGKIIKIES